MFLVKYLFNVRDEKINTKTTDLSSDNTPKKYKMRRSASSNYRTNDTTTDKNISMSSSLPTSSPSTLRMNNDRNNATVPPSSSSSSYISKLSRVLLPNFMTYYNRKGASDSKNKSTSSISNSKVDYFMTKETINRTGSKRVTVTSSLESPQRTRRGSNGASSTKCAPSAAINTTSSGSNNHDNNSLSESINRISINEKSRSLPNIYPDNRNIPRSSNNSSSSSSSGMSGSSALPDQNKYRKNSNSRMLSMHSTSSSNLPVTSPTSNSTPTSLVTASSAPSTKLCCDKCDGKHLTDECPYYKKSRESHPDAQKNAYIKLGGTSSLPGATLNGNMKVIRQPGDGSCLFHSMSYGLKDGSNANSLRAEICKFISNNPSFKICDTPLSDWVRWDSESNCADYARRMSRGSWGGGIEMACVSRIKSCNIHVYEKSFLSGGYKRISAFDYPDEPQKRNCIKVLYQGGVHYDAIV